MQLIKTKFPVEKALPNRGSEAVLRTRTIMAFYVRPSALSSSYATAWAMCVYAGESRRRVDDRRENVLEFIASVPKDADQRSLGTTPFARLMPTLISRRDTTIPNCTEWGRPADGGRFSKRCHGGPCGSDSRIYQLAQRPGNFPGRSTIR